MKHANLFLFFSIFLLSNIASQQPTLLPYPVGDKWGYCDTNGVLIIPAEYDGAEYFTRTGGNTHYPLDFWHAVVKNGDFINWIDERGKKIFPFDSIKYINSYPINSERIVVTISLPRQWGHQEYGALINNKLQIIRPFECAKFQNLGRVDDIEFDIAWEGLDATWTAWPHSWNGSSITDQILLEKCKGLKGILNAEGKTLVEPEFEWISTVYDHKYLARLPGHPGYSLYKLPRKILDSFPYTPISGINNGLVGVCTQNEKRENHCGFVDLNGKTIVPFQYTEIYGFYRGIALGHRPDSTWDVLDTKGKVRFRIREIDQIAAYTHHFFIGQDSGRWRGYDYQFKPFLNGTIAGPPLLLSREGIHCYRIKSGFDSVYIDMKGNELSRHSYDYYNTIDGLSKHPFCYVANRGGWGIAQQLNSFQWKEIFPPRFDDGFRLDGNFAVATLHGKKGVLHISGKTIVPFEWDDVFIHRDYENPDAVWIDVQRNKRAGRYDTLGNILIPCVLQQYGNYGLPPEHLVWLDSLDFVNYLCDGKGGVITFDSSYHFQSAYNQWGEWDYKMTDRPCFLVKHHNKSGLMDTKGIWVIAPEHDQCKITDDGRFAVTLDTGLWSIWERSTQQMLLQSREEFEVWGKGIFKRVYRDGKTIYQVWNSGKKTMLESPYEVWSFHNGLAAFRGEQYWGFCDENLNPVIPPQFDGVQSFNQGVSIVNKNNLYGLIDTLGNVLIPFEYKEISYQENGLFLLKKGGSGEWSLVTSRNKILQTNVYRIDILRGNKFLITAGKAEMAEDSLKYSLIDPSGETVIDRADKIFPIAMGAVYLKNGKYYEYGLPEGALFKALSRFNQMSPINDSLLWAGIVTAETDIQFYGIQGIFNTAGKPVIPMDYQRIDYREASGAFMVYRTYGSALFDSRGKQLSPFNLSGFEYSSLTPFCYSITERDKEDPKYLTEWWITLSGKKIFMKRKWTIR